MSAHSEVEGHLGRHGKTYSGATAGCATLTAANTNFSHQELMDLIDVLKASGYELTLTAGAMKIRPKDSTL